MKVVVIGNGNVGKAVFRELQSFREIDELALVGRNADACRAEAEDYWDAVPLRIDVPAKIVGGGYELSKDADILIYCAGPSISKEDRLSVAEKNVKVVRAIFAEIDKYAPNAMVVDVTNPLDVVTTAITRFTNRPANKVLGTGTMLDTARLIKMLSMVFGISYENITGYVIGEHGNSSVVLTSGIRILGMRLEEYERANCGGIIPVIGVSREDYLNKHFMGDMPDYPKVLEQKVREAGFKIFRGKGYTSSGVAAAAARVVFDIINNTHRIYPVSTVLHGEYGVNGFAISVPCMIGKKGIESIQNISMTDYEKEKFGLSADIIEKTCRENGVL